MSKFKGTPGPWECVRRSHGVMLIRSEVSGVNGYLAEIYSSRPNDREANARLISAAPKLLDAAIMAIEHYDAYFEGSEPPEDLPWVPVMREAIKEALGEDAP